MLQTYAEPLTTELRVLIADNHVLFRKGLARLVNRLPNIRARITEARSYGEVNRALDQSGPFDLIIIDMLIPGAAPAEGLRRLTARAPATDIVVVTLSAFDRHIATAQQAGVAAVVIKGAGGAHLRDVLRSVLAGTPAPARPKEAANGSATVTLPLTPRQQDVFRKICEGMSNRQIAEDLELAEGTVKVHVTAILKALKVRNRTQAVLRGERLGIGRASRAQEYC
ncbi:LuxR C-terminal-related transcriptional regulator [Oceanibacterium hippocampi]|uniref:Transcriptional regulatory protein DegU n=1 Tax=Oceanibacterium hippocampi TaxID=745714 RepID=A0A1Y5RCB1_9PROT|nr:response regulator transcription factor [Oceanibacterium hippocampi]SLN11597.1 Transcriptional regulatory protein DegU [Oceanibacterium hippocampi]